MREAGGGSGPKDAQRGDLFVGACLPDRHCERSEAIQALSADAVWIASSQGLLAMTSLWLGSRTTIRPPSPRPERGLAEQRLLGRGLRAPILRRRFDLAAEFGCGVPGPARVVEQAAGERDHVGLAGCDDVFGLPRLGDQADGDGGQTRLALDGLGKLHLIAGAKRDLLQRRDAAG